MSTADSQLLCASSAFASDVYKPVIRKNKSTDKEMFWAGRYVVLIIAIIAVLIASNPNSKSIMGLVENAWGIFGAAFGPAILLSLFWKRFTFAGAVAGIFVGAAFGPAILLSLFWKRFTFKGAVAGIAAGAIVDIGWLIVHGRMTAADPAYAGIFTLYEILPGFVAGLVIAVIVTLIDRHPSAEVEELFDAGVNYSEE